MGFSKSKVINHNHFSSPRRPRPVSSMSQPPDVAKPYSPDCIFTYSSYWAANRHRHSPPAAPFSSSAASWYNSGGAERVCQLGRFSRSWDTTPWADPLRIDRSPIRAFDPSFSLETWLPPLFFSPLASRQLLWNRRGLQWEWLLPGWSTAIGWVGPSHFVSDGRPWWRMYCKRRTRPNLWHWGSIPVLIASTYER